MPEVDIARGAERQDPASGTPRRRPAHQHADPHRRAGLRRRTAAAGAAAGRTVRPGLALHPRVDRSALITVRMAKYSVPARLIGRQVRVSLRASEVVVFDGHDRGRPPRTGRRAAAGKSINLDHYLEVLRHKPGAFPGSTALARARESGAFTAAHEAFWQARPQSRRRHRRHPRADRRAAPAPQHARRRRDRRDPRRPDRRRGIRGRRRGRSPPARGWVRTQTVIPLNTHRHAVQRVVSLTQRRLADPAAVIAGLPPDRRPLPSVAAYDELLNRRRARPPRPPMKEGTTGT